MEGAEILDLQHLLAPLSEDNAVGDDPRQDLSVNSPYLQMKDARAEARRIERAIDTDGDGPSPDASWATVLENGIEILASQGKDLEVSAWISEALVRLHGFEGLLCGFKLSQGLIKEYWDTIYPLPDEDGMEPRILPFLGLNGQSEDSPLIQCLRKLSVTGSHDPYGYWQYQKAIEISKTADEAQRAEKIAAGNITLEEFNAAVAGNPARYYKELVDILNELKQELDDFYNLFYGYVGADAPAVSGITNALQQILEAIELFAKKKLDDARAAQERQDEDSAVKEVESNGDAAEVRGNRSGVSNREEALRQITKIAAFFRENEPHSPISYTLEELVKRARMTLPELIQELIVDEEARRYFLISTGMGAPKHEADSASTEE